MADAQLLIKILADTSDASRNINALVGDLGQLTAGKTLGGAGSQLVQAAMQQQDAMARIQTAFNSTDFTPGTQKFQAAHDKIIDLSQKLATSFPDLAATYAQGAKFIDEAGNHLSTDKIDEYTDAVTRLSKVSTDLDPTRAGQLVETFAKVYGTTDFAGIANAATTLSGGHNMGEGPALEGAIAIGQAGAQLGVRPEQALGVSNTLVDLGMSGQLGAGGMGAAGSSIIRQIMLMQQSADNILDPEASYKFARQHREASERVDDLDFSSEEAQAKQAEMFDSRGRLKRQFLRNPSSKMAIDHAAARAQREASDARADLGHLDEEHLGGLDTAGRGGMNASAMAGVAGMSAEDFAQLTRSDPMEALLAFTRGAAALPEEQRSKAFRQAGLKNVRDVKLDEMLGGRATVVDEQIANAAAGLNDPTHADLLGRSNTMLGTTSAGVTNAANTVQNDAAAGGDPLRRALDATLPKMTADANTAIQGMAAAEKVVAEGADKVKAAVDGLPDPLKNLADMTKQVADNFGTLPPVVQDIVKIAAPLALRGGVGPAGVLSTTAVAGAQLKQNAEDFAAGKINAGQLVGRTVASIPMPGANELGQTIAGGSGDANIELGGITLHLGDAANPQLIQQAATQAAQQVYAAIMGAAAEAAKAPSSQLGGAR